MSHNDTKHRVFYWLLIICTMSLIIVGWWFFNKSNWQNLNEVNEIEQIRTAELEAGLNEISDEFREALNVVEDGIEAEAEEVARELQEEEAKENLIDSLKTEIESVNEEQPEEEVVIEETTL